MSRQELSLFTKAVMLSHVTPSIHKQWVCLFASKLAKLANPMRVTADRLCNQ